MRHRIPCAGLRPVRARCISRARARRGGCCDHHADRTLPLPALRRSTSCAPPAGCSKRSEVAQKWMRSCNTPLSTHGWKHFSCSQFAAKPPPHPPRCFPTPLAPGCMDHLRPRPTTRTSLFAARAAEVRISLPAATAAGQPPLPPAFHALRSGNVWVARLEGRSGCATVSSCPRLPLARGG